VKQILFLIGVSLLFSACSQNSEKKESLKSNKIMTTNDIVITDNEKAYESKVQSAGNITDKSYYYSYNQKVIDKDSKRSTVDANMNIRSAYENVKISHIVKKLSKNFLLKCSPCHNDYANGLIGPSLLSSDGNTIYENMMKYKSGEKKNALMTEIIAQIDYKEIKELSSEIAAFNIAVKKLTKVKK